jgi:hypothetical protein
LLVHEGDLLYFEVSGKWRGRRGKKFIYLQIYQVNLVYSYE